MLNGSSHITRHNSLIVFVLMSISTHAFAQQAKYECENVDLRREAVKKVSNPLKAAELQQYFTPQANEQLNLGFCFAHVMGTAAALKHRITPSRLSIANRVIDSKAMEAYFKRDKDIDEYLVNGTVLEDALDAVNGQKVCLEKDLPTRPQTFVSTRFTPEKMNSWAESYLELRQMHAHLYASQALPHDEQGVEARKKLENALCKEHSVQRLFSNLYPHEIAGILWEARDRSFPELLTQLEEKNCRGRMIDVPKFKIQKRSQAKELPLSFVMHQAMNRHQPVVYGFVAPENRNAEPRVGHAMAIVGREKVGKRCYFVALNSWGASGCASRGPGYFATNPADVLCRNDGTVLLSEEAIADTGNEIAVFE